MLLMGLEMFTVCWERTQRGWRMGPDQSPRHLDPPVDQTAPTSSPLLHARGYLHSLTTQSQGNLVRLQMKDYADRYMDLDFYPTPLASLTQPRTANFY